jgi:hypothetical protein
VGGHRRPWPVIGVLTILLLLPVAASAARVVADEALLRGDLSALEPADRSVTASIVDSTGQNRYETLDAGVRLALAPLGGTPIREVIYRAASDSNGGGFVLGGVDGLSGLARLTEGRLPMDCRPTQCEVLEVGSSTSTTFDAGVVRSSFGLVVVGKAERTDDLLLSGTFEPDAASPLLVGDGTPAVAALAALSTHGRTYGWVTPVDPARVAEIGVNDWLKQATSTGEALLLVHPFLVLTLPNDAVAAEARRADISADHFRLLLGGAFAALALVAGCLVAIRRRTDAPKLQPLDSIPTFARDMLGIALATLLAAVLVLAICGALAGGSPLGFGRIARSALDGLPVDGVILAVICAAAIVGTFGKGRRGTDDPGTPDHQ